MTEFLQVALNEQQVKLLMLAGGKSSGANIDWSTARQNTAVLKAYGLTYDTYEDDQPTTYATPLGEAYIAYLETTASGESK